MDEVKHRCGIELNNFLGQNIVTSSLLQTLVIHANFDMSCYTMVAEVDRVIVLYSTSGNM